MSRSFRKRSYGSMLGNKSQKDDKRTYNRP